MPEPSPSILRVRVLVFTTTACISCKVFSCCTTTTAKTILIYLAALACRRHRREVTRRTSTPYRICLAPAMVKFPDSSDSRSSIRWKTRRQRISSVHGTIHGVQVSWGPATGDLLFDASRCPDLDDSVRDGPGRASSGSRCSFLEHSGHRASGLSSISAAHYDACGSSSIVISSALTRTI